MEEPRIKEKLLKVDDPPRIVLIALGALILLALGLQMEAFYLEFNYNKNGAQHIIRCFHNPYPYRLTILLFGMLSFILSCSILYKRNWKFFNNYFFNSILFTPILIFIFDQLVNLYVSGNL